MKKLLVALFAVSCYNAAAQTTLIPDPVFEQVLINLHIDTDGLINGQMANTDALAVTTLTITSPSIVDTSGTIHDVTGLEAFVNLENLTVNITMIEELNVSTLVNLKRLNCTDNMLTSLDVSHNPLLEYLDITSWGDVYPINGITEIDLSNNPLINELIAIGSISKINLKNGNNNPDMRLIIGPILGGYPPDYIYGNTCIEVDNEDLAQNNAFPYSEWVITHLNQSYSMVANCSLGSQDFNSNAILLYPNPVSDVLHIQSQNPDVESVSVIDFSGRIVKDYHNVDETISVSGLSEGTYFVKIVSGQGVQLQKIIIKY